MGVFARLRRKTKRTAEEYGSASPAAGTAVDGAFAPEASEAVPDTVAGSESDGDRDRERDGGTSAAEGVEIPKQQTADKAADNEAGEGARA